MWRDTVLVAGKDLRIEMRSRVLLNQVIPFAALWSSCSSPSPWAPTAPP